MLKRAIHQSPSPSLPLILGQDIDVQVCGGEGNLHLRSTRWVVDSADITLVGWLQRAIRLQGVRRVALLDLREPRFGRLLLEETGIGRPKDVSDDGVVLVRVDQDKTEASGEPYVGFGVHQTDELSETVEMLRRGSSVTGEEAYAGDGG